MGRSLPDHNSISAVHIGLPQSQSVERLSSLGGKLARERNGEADENLLSGFHGCGLFIVGAFRAFSAQKCAKYVTHISCKIRDPALVFSVITLPGGSL